LIKNSQPFGKKFQKTVGGLTHTVDLPNLSTSSVSGFQNFAGENITEQFFFFLHNAALIFDFCVCSAFHDKTFECFKQRRAIDFSTTFNSAQSRANKKYRSHLQIIFASQQYCSRTAKQWKRV